MVECQLGFPLFHEIEKTKIKLGKNVEANFEYLFPGIEILQAVSKAGYEGSVTPTVDEIMATMLDVFNQSGLSPTNVDEVILTGGTSQFPLIQSRLEGFFGSQKLYEHNIYQSVVNGLAQYARKLI